MIGYLDWREWLPLLLLLFNTCLEVALLDGECWIDVPCVTYLSTWQRNGFLEVSIIAWEIDGLYVAFIDWLGHDQGPVEDLPFVSADALSRLLSSVLALHSCAVFLFIYKFLSNREISIKVQLLFKPSVLKCVSYQFNLMLVSPRNDFD